MKTEALKTAGTMVARKSPNHLAGILIGVLLAIQFPELTELVKKHVGALGVGSGGAGLLALSIWLTVSKDKKHAGEVLEALMTPAPAEPPEKP